MPGVSRSRFPHALRWTIPAVAVLGVAAVATPILALRRSPQPVSAASVVTPPPFSWAAGRRAAPDFVLRDQNGLPVSIAAYRGRPVIVTFIDPLCRNLCPLEAQVLNQMERQLPAAQRPVILAISVDVWADTRADLLQTIHEWHLVPEWRWAVGRRAQLAAVWSRYEVGVKVTTKRVAGTTINYITHTEAAYVVDASGHERALFFWPFFPQDVRRVLRQIA
jgi:cytochrome oxidase Cu insertion factor (SCO1/SenC/PrrC family)